MIDEIWRICDFCGSEEQEDVCTQCHNRIDNKTAKEMFLEIGYKKIEPKLIGIQKEHCKDILAYKDNEDYAITFHMPSRTYQISDKHYSSTSINTKEHAAITQQLVELKWIESEE